MKSIDPSDPIQLGLFTFTVTINECDLSNQKEKDLVFFLKNLIDTLKSVHGAEEILVQIATGSNAILASLDGTKYWHEEILNVANMLVDGLSDYYRGEGELSVKKAQFGDPLSPTIKRESSDYSDLVALASNPDTPTDELLRLAKHNDWRIKSSVAKNPSTPLWLIEEFAGDRDEAVRAGVASNPNIPASLMETLSNDSSEYVRDYLAQNAMTPAYLLEKLAQDPHWMPRSGVADNPSTQPELLIKLAEDPDKRVAHIAKNNSAYVPDI